MAGLIAVDELLASPGFEGLDSGQAEQLIKQASSIVRLCARGLLDAVETPDAPDIIETVVVQMIRRGLSNPLGVTQEQLGDHSRSFGGVVAATLYITGREKRMVRQEVGLLGVGSVPMESDLPRQPSEPAGLLSDGEITL